MNNRFHIFFRCKRQSALLFLQRPALRGRLSIQNPCIPDSWLYSTNQHCKRICDVRDEKLHKTLQLFLRLKRPCVSDFVRNNSGNIRFNRQDIYDLYSVTAIGIIHRTFQDIIVCQKTSAFISFYIRIALILNLKSFYSHERGFG